MNELQLPVVFVLIPFLYLYQRKCLTNQVKYTHSLNSPGFFFVLVINWSVCAAHDPEETGFKVQLRLIKMC